MFKAIKEFFFGKETPAPKVEDSKVEAVNAAPYKVEAPVVADLADIAIAQRKPAPVAKPAKAKAPAKKAPAAKAKAPAKKTLAKAGDKKPAKKAPAKKTK